MNETNYRKWTDLLRSGNIAQANGSLVELRDGDTKAMCCLGVGSLAAGLPMNLEPEKEGFRGTYEGAHWGNALPPLEFLVWLGLMTEEDFDKRRKAGVTMTDDVEIDWPADMVVFADQNEDPDLVYGVTDADLGSAATLNDAGFTFSQIADIMDYMGIKPVKPLPEQYKF